MTNNEHDVVKDGEIKAGDPLKSTFKEKHDNSSDPKYKKIAEKIADLVAKGRVGMAESGSPAYDTPEFRKELVNQFISAFEEAIPNSGIFDDLEEKYYVTEHIIDEYEERDTLYKSKRKLPDNISKGDIVVLIGGDLVTVDKVEKNPETGQQETSFINIKGERETINPLTVRSVGYTAKFIEAISAPVVEQEPPAPETPVDELKL